MIEGEEWKCAGYIGVPTAEDVKKYCHDHWTFIMELEHHAYPQKLTFGTFKADGDVVALSSGGYSAMMFDAVLWVKRTQIVLLALVSNPNHIACTKKPPKGSLTTTNHTTVAEKAFLEKLNDLQAPTYDAKCDCFFCRQQRKNEETEEEEGNEEE